jgi:hypothetical protein
MHSQCWSPCCPAAQSAWAKREGGIAAPVRQDHQDKRTFFAQYTIKELLTGRLRDLDQPAPVFADIGYLCAKRWSPRPARASSRANGRMYKKSAV